MNFIKTLLTLFTVINVSYAFDWDKCRKQEILGGAGFMAFSVSSTQFTSSWGGCAMIGMAEHDKKVFLVQNFENIKIDSARGTGEYIEAYAIVSMCDHKARNELSRAFQKNFTYIYGDSVEKQPEQVYESMERVIKMDSTLSVGCNRKI